MCLEKLFSILFWSRTSFVLLTGEFNEVHSEHKPQYIYVSELPKCQVILARVQGSAMSKTYVMVGQAFFTAFNAGGFDELATAAHCLQIGETYAISKDGKQFEEVISWEVPRDSPVKDVAVFKVRKGVGTRLAAAPAGFHFRCANGETVTVAAAGLRDTGKILQSLGKISSMPRNEGTLICSHTCDTEPGFSGAPIFCGNKVVAIHTTGVSRSTTNAGLWAWPVFGTTVRPLMQQESSEDGFGWAKTEDFTTMQTGDKLYVRTASGNNYAFDFTAEVEAKLKVANEQMRLRNYSYTAPVLKGRSWAEEQPDIDYNEQIVWEKLDHVNQTKLDRPRHNLEPGNVQTGMQAYSRMLQAKDEARLLLETLNRTGNLNLARRDRNASMQLSSDVLFLQRFVENINVSTTRASELFEEIVAKSAEDEAESIRWARYRHKHTRPTPQVALQNHVAHWAGVIAHELAVLEEIPKRPMQRVDAVETPEDSEDSDEEMNQESLHHCNDVFACYGISFKEDKRDFPERAVQAAPREVTPPVLQEPAPIPETKSQVGVQTETPKQGLRVQACVQTETVVQMRSSETQTPQQPHPVEQESSLTATLSTLTQELKRLQSISVQPSQDTKGTDGPRKPRTQKRSKKASGITQESILQRSAEQPALISQISPEQLTELRNALLKTTTVDPEVKTGVTLKS